MINHTLEENKLCLSSQSVVPLCQCESCDKRKHYEILIRMKGEDGKIIPPGAFLPATERCNLSAKLDRWVVKTVFDLLPNRPMELKELTFC